jgi:hypothetical protein
MLPFGLQLKTFEPLRHLPITLEIFNIEKEKERDDKIFGIVKIKQESKKNKKNKQSNKNKTIKQNS